MWGSDFLGAKIITETQHTKLMHVLILYEWNDKRHARCLRTNINNLEHFIKHWKWNLTLTPQLQIWTMISQHLHKLLKLKMNSVKFMILIEQVGNPLESRGCKGYFQRELWQGELSNKKWEFRWLLPLMISVYKSKTINFKTRVPKSLTFTKKKYKF